jgi:hypothetical protein
VPPSLCAVAERVLLESAPFETFSRNFHNGLMWPIEMVTERKLQYLVFARAR